MSDSPEDRQQPHTATTMEALPSIDRHVRSDEQTAAARATPKLSVTTLLIGITAFVFLLSIVFGEGFLTFSPSALYRLGGNLAALSLTGDAWRLLTNVFLHAGIVHLLLNMYLLLLVGRLAERWFGQAGTLAIYLLGGLWASYASACWLGWQLVSQADASMTVSVGASGAIMALCGALIVMAWLYDDTPPLLAREGATLPGTGKVLMQTVAINIVMGFAIKGVDQAAHLGGLLAGAIFGLAVGAATDVARIGWSPHRRIVFTAIAALAVLYACLSLAPWPALREWRISWNQEAAEQDAVEQRAEDERRAERDARRAEAAAAKVRAKAAAALRAALPPPVTEQESAGQAVKWADAAAVARLDAEFPPPPAPKNPPENVGQILPRQGPADGLLVTWPSADSLQLIRPGAANTPSEVVAAWMLCDAEYMGQITEPGAAWHDGAGRELVASLGHQPVVRVTDVATGVEIGMYLMPGLPKSARFSPDGKRMVVESRDSDGHDYMNIVDIARRMSEADARKYIPQEFICGWSGGAKVQ